MSRGETRPLSIAPMLDRTDRHFRYFVRRITTRTLLYSEMVTTGAILHGDRDRYLAFDPAEKPLALQLGGDDPAALARCAEIGAGYGYDEINLNVGCPSDRVQRGSFGASLMARPEQVAAAVEAMRAAVDLPVTVKHRIGIDDLDRYEDMSAFVTVVAAAGCDRFSVHARKAWLKGLSARENRTVPPLRYEDVYRLKEENPELQVEINGGILTLDETERHLERVDGVMIGRAAYDDPFMLAEADSRIFGEALPAPSREEIVHRMVPYVQDCRDRDVYLSRVVRHMLGLYSGVRGARAWRRILTVEGCHRGAGPEVLLKAMETVEQAMAEQA
jgi:tRNA-dihydrouridine synthase A